jgi:hypothetical protein
MTQEDKELLMKDLCARLPYRVKAYIKNWSKLDQKYYEGVYTVETVHPSLNDIYASTENGSVGVILGHTDYIIKPYLFPLSSMTEEQLYNNPIGFYQMLTIKADRDWKTITIDRRAYYKLVDWFNKNHFDYRGLIEKGLAIDATGLNIY